MRPYNVVLDLNDSDPNDTKARVCYHERDTAERLGQSAEVTVYIDRRGLRLPELSNVAILQAEHFLRRILEAPQ